MSPTSCRCSTPRRVLSRSGRVRAGGPAPRGGWGVPAVASPPVGSPPQYSPALRWVTTGFGMGPGGASTLSATGTPHPPSARGRDPLLRHDRGRGDAPHAPACAPTHPASPHPLTPWTRPGRSCVLGRAAAAGTRWLDLPLARAAPMPRHDTGMETDCGDPPSTIRTARLQSVARGPPAAYQPGHLPGVLPRYEWGCSSWGGIPA